MSRSTHGFFIFLAKELRGSGGLELAFGEGACSVRRGKGGGEVVSSIDVPGIVDGGTGWRCAELRMDSPGVVNVLLDNGRRLDVDFSERLDEVEVGISSTSKGCADFVVTRFEHTELRPSFDAGRRYASYFSSVPERVGGIEVLSSSDICYIDKDGWKSLVLHRGIPIVVGDESSMPTLRRANIFKRSEDEAAMHTSFTERSLGCVERARSLAEGGVVLNSDSNLVKVFDEESRSAGVPVVFSVLSPAVVHDKSIVEAYKRLSDNGPTGERLSSSEDDVLAYLDGATSNGRHSRFFFELIECLSLEQRRELLEELQKKLA